MPHAAAVIPSKFAFNSRISQLAVREVDENWSLWQESFPQGEPSERAFSETIPDLISFYAFGFDYSVFRRLKRQHLAEIFRFLRKQEAPSSPAELNHELGNFIEKELNKSLKPSCQSSTNNFSMCSKLMTMWRPDRFYMIDSLNRRALKELHKEVDFRGNAFSSASQRSYEALEATFNALLSKNEFPRLGDMSIPEPQIARRRFIDAYFVRWGRELQEKDEEAKQQTDPR